jgi:hypothetical protein
MLSIEKLYSHVQLMDGISERVSKDNFVLPDIELTSIPFNPTVMDVKNKDGVRRQMDYRRS